MKGKINSKPEWVKRGKSIKDLIVELQTFEDQNIEVKISTNDGKSSKPISLVTQHKNGRECWLEYCG